MQFRLGKRVYQIRLVSSLKHIRFAYAKNSYGTIGVNILGIIIKARLLNCYERSLYNGCKAHCYATANIYKFGGLFKRK